MNIAESAAVVGTACEQHSASSSPTTYMFQAAHCNPLILLPPSPSLTASRSLVPFRGPPTSPWRERESVLGEVCEAKCSLRFQTSIPILQDMREHQCHLVVFSKFT